jgi:hypothetical protein
VEGAVTLASLTLVMGGCALIAMSACSWWARRNGRICPVTKLLGARLDHVSTPMTIWERFEDPFYFLAGLLLIGAGLTLHHGF